MATKQRSRSRRSHSPRDRAPRFVAPVLDLTWQSPYAPTSPERHANLVAVRHFALRRRLAFATMVGALVLLLLAGVVLAPWLPALGVVIAIAYAWDLRRSLIRYERQGRALGELVLEQFQPSGSPKDRERLVTVLDRLAATFGVASVSAFIVADPAYNAALVPNGDVFSLVVTDALMRDFELIELEGVVAHCLARHRLGLLTREAAASVATLSDDARAQLAGAGAAYRADEVAAAAIRYPLGLAGALRKCRDQAVAGTSFFAGPTYATWRWIWFDVHSDRRDSDLGDLDDVTLRAMALEEW
jgi:hypothetical protein